PNGRDYSLVRRHHPRQEGRARADCRSRQPARSLRGRNREVHSFDPTSEPPFRCEAQDRLGRGHFFWRLPRIASPYGTKPPSAGTRARRRWATEEVSHANFVRRSFHDNDGRHACRERPPECGRGDLSLVRRLFGPRRIWLRELRVYFIAAMPGDTRWQWRLLQSESPLSTLSAAAHTFASHTAVTLIPSVSCRRCSPNAPFARVEMLTADRP